jgi:hypothetical protein
VVLGVFSSEWTYAKMKIHTVDSRSESLHQILQDISPHDALKLSKEGWRYPLQVLHNWKEAEQLIQKQFADRIRHRLELVSLLHMGSTNARLLETAGIDSRKELASENPDKLFAQLIKVNQTIRLRNNPLVRRRVAAWVHAATRQSVFY